eukprot:764861-Hanusia_phi.AAC.4
MGGWEEGRCWGGGNPGKRGGRGGVAALSVTTFYGESSGELRRRRVEETREGEKSLTESQKY